MKKLFGFMMIGLVSICLTGCGSNPKNTITCTQSDGDYRMTYAASYNKDNKFIKVTTTTEATAPSKDELNSFYDEMKPSMDEINKQTGLKASMKKEGLTLVMSMEIDLTKVSKEILEDHDLSEMLDMTVDEFKKEMTDSGFTCK